MSNTSQNRPDEYIISHQRKQMKWFLILCVSILLMTATTDFLISMYGKGNVAKERNPLVTVKKTPTPFLFPTQTPSASPTAMLKASPSPKTSNPTMKVCPMDAKLCPDGKTYVGRSGPNCEFVACLK